MGSIAKSLRRHDFVIMTSGVFMCTQQNSPRHPFQSQPIALRPSMVHRRARGLAPALRGMNLMRAITYHTVLSPKLRIYSARLRRHLRLPSEAAPVLLLRSPKELTQ